MPGDSAGSRLAEISADLGQYDCAQPLWRYDSCSAAVRVVDATEATTDKITVSTASVSGSSSDARVDALQFVISTEPDRNDRNQTRPGFGVIYGTAECPRDCPQGQDPLFAWEAHLVAFDSVLEYTPSSPGAPFDCSSVSDSNWRACPGILSAVRLLPLREWMPLSFTSSNGGTVFTGIAETVDGFDGQFKFRMTCTTSNQQFQADGRTFSPYQMSTCAAAVLC